MIDAVAEFDRQVDVLSQRIKNNVFRYDLSRLKEASAGLRLKISELAAAQEVREGNIPVVVVFKVQVASYDDLLRQLHHKNREGYVEMTPKNPEDFVDVNSLAVPESDIYVLWDVDTGRSMLNISPSDSVAMIESKGRAPLTMYEGDQRVPSIWISKGAPRLGWCWFGNIHTWLATASCKLRVEGG